MQRSNSKHQISKRSFLDLYGVIKIKKLINIKALRKRFECAMAEKVMINNASLRIFPNFKDWQSLKLIDFEESPSS